MSIVYKGSPSLNLSKLPETTVAAAIVGTGAVIAALSMIFWLPYVYCKVVRHDYSAFCVLPFVCPALLRAKLTTVPSSLLFCFPALRWFHFFFGPALWWREAPADAEEVAKGNTAVPDYRVYQDETDVRELPMANATGVVGAQQDLSSFPARFASFLLLRSTSL
jgi:sodium-dependent phosphate transporter